MSRGDLDEAERVLTDARRVLRSSGFTPFALFAETQLARCALERGEAPEALASLSRIVEEAGGLGHAGIVLEITVYFAQAQALAGDAAAGLEALDAASVAAGEEAALLSVPVDRVRAACLLSLGRSDEAAACLDRALVAAERQGLLYEQLLVHRARRVLRGERDPEEASEELREATRLAQLLGVAI